MAKEIVVACVNLKGGVGKTALAVNFAAYAGQTGLKTLLVDLDPQTNATFSCITAKQWEDHSLSHGTVADILGARKSFGATGVEKKPEEVVIKDVFDNVDLIPSHLDLFTIDLDMAGATARETKLARSMKDFKKNYDLIICDCPPNLTIPTQNALAMSNYYVIPVSPDYLSSIGVALLKTRVAGFCADISHGIDLAGIALTRIGRPAIYRDEIVSALRKQFGAEVLESEIKERVQVSETASRQKPIFVGSDKDAINEFTNLSLEIIGRIGA
ncbi:AAA family ATPase [Rhodanobacter sp. Root179]|uniref:ParA family protein n=1 Tax=Rhodanobacter sp. Root179 TaxID=1736482 RepID=UPI0009E94EC5|nr:AAA family ATPase [Rhodanobacter sp. Root179]